MRSDMVQMPCVKLVRLATTVPEVRANTRDEALRYREDNTGLVQLTGVVLQDRAESDLDNEAAAACYCLLMHSPRPQRLQNTHSIIRTPLRRFK